MPINKSDVVFIGNAGGICGYMSHGINIIRKSTSLTGKRIEKDPSFEGFRNSGNRMKEASPIAASLYNLLPKEQKVFAFYRTLTGEALKMIKQGLDKEIVRARLKEQYIDPVMERLPDAGNQMNQKHQTLTEEPNNNGNSSLFSKNLLRIHPYTRGEKRYLRVKRALQYSDNGANQFGSTEEHYSYDSSGRQHLPVNVTSHQTIMNPRQNRVSQFSELIYMGKCKDCKGLKMWLRPRY